MCKPEDQEKTIGDKLEKKSCGVRVCTRDVEAALWETNEEHFEDVGPLAEQPPGKQLPSKLSRDDFEPPQKDAVPYCKESPLAPLWYILAALNQVVFGIIVIPIAVVVTVLFDICNPRLHKSCSVLNVLEEIVVRILGSIRKILDIPWLIVTYLNGATWTDLLEICLEKNYFLMTLWLENLYNPQLYFRNDKAIFLFGRAGMAEKVHTLSGVPAPDDSEIKKRKASMEMIARFSRERTDSASLKLLETCNKHGVDLNWPSPHGYTVVMLAMQNRRKKTLEWLLDQHDVDLNRQDHYSGNTGMHKLVQKQQIKKHGDEAVANVLEMLLKDKRTNFTILNFHGDVKNRGIGSWFRKPTARDYGCTPYMLLPDGDQYRKSAEALKPKPSFDELLNAMKSGKKAKKKCSAIYKLIAESREDKDDSLHHLRVMDMLFCPREGTPQELGNRRKQVFDHFLKTMILKSAEKQGLDKKEVALLRWVYYQSAGPPGMTRDVARATYLKKFKSMMDSAKEKIEQRYEQAYESLQSQEGANELFSIKKEVNYIEPKDLKHSTFLKFPDFIRNFNGIQAVRDLHAVGAISHSGDFCNLLQGRHRLFGDQPVIGLFLSDPNDTGSGGIPCYKEDATLWNSLILLWQICLQENIEDEFNQTMKAIADSVEGVEFTTPPKVKYPGSDKESGVKSYFRSYEKADKDYKKYEDVAACMRVIDGLRCSFVVNTVSQNLAVGKLLEEKFGVARTKNWHQPNHFNYADRKYNVVFESKTKVAGVDYDINVLCEIQILIKEYNDIKKDGHLLYEFVREPEQKKPLNLRSSTRDAKNCVCAFGKYWTIFLIFLGAAFIVAFVRNALVHCHLTKECTSCSVTQQPYSKCWRCGMDASCTKYYLEDPYEIDVECKTDSSDPNSCTCGLLSSGYDPQTGFDKPGFVQEILETQPCSYFKTTEPA